MKLQVIYQIRNIVDKKLYIGSAIDFLQRKALHLSHLRCNKHHSILLQRAWNKYGEENFRFEVITVIKDKSKLIEIEQLYLDILKPKYNICKIAGSRLGVIGKTSPNKGKTGIYSQERIDQIILSVSKKYKCPHCSKEANHRNLVRWHNDNCPKNPNLSFESISKKLLDRTNMSLLKKDKPKPYLNKSIVQLNKETCIKIKEWGSLTQASEELKVYKGLICRACKGTAPSAYGFKWMYKSDYDKLLEQAA